MALVAVVRVLGSERVLNRAPVRVPTVGEGLDVSPELLMEGEL